MRARFFLALRAALELALATIVFVAGGCAYNTTGRSGANVGDVYIPFFRDETTGSRAQDLGTRMTELLVNEFLQDKEIRVFQGDRERELATKELLGTVKRFSEGVVTRGADELNEEYRVAVSCAIKFLEIKGNTILWEDANVTGDGNYLLEDGEEGFAAAVNEALDEILDKILDKTVRAW